MRSILLFITCVSAILLAAGQTSPENEFPKSFKIVVTNTLNATRQSVMVTLSPTQISKVKDFNPKAFVVMDKQSEVPSQFNNGNPEKGIVFVLASMAPSEKRQLIIRYHPTATITRNYKKLTQAELSYRTGGEWKNREYIGGTFKNTNFLRVPKEHKDHSWFLRYEGPGWESDKVAYRMYLDQRNATDVFGKKTTEPILQNVGQDGFDSYHNMQPWGMDVMKVGKSLGVGSIGMMESGVATRVEKTDSVNCTITENGPVYSSVLTNYFGWLVNNNKRDVQSLISIHAGTRLTHEQLKVTGKADPIVTGIVKDPKAKLVSSKGDAQRWGYIATWGTQSLNNDDLGMVVFFEPGSFVNFTEDEFSHIVSLKPESSKLDYYLAGVWSGEPGGITTEAQFMDYINATAAELANAVRVAVASK
ncbi:MAG: DUF4861 domain-containing protein [Chryseolinea sp.]